MGVLGLSFSEFCLLTVEEIGFIAKARQDYDEQRRRDDWSRMRLLATLVMQPHCKNTLKPDKLLPFPWESSRDEEQETKEQWQERLAQRKALEKNH